MTSFVRTSFASLSTSCALVALLALSGACGGDDGGVTVVDAAVDAVIDAVPDAPPLVCNAPSMNCGGMCVNTTNTEMYCGDCNTACTGGRLCQSSACACPTATPPTTVSAGLPSIAVSAQGVLFGASSISGNALVAVVDPANTTLNQAYTMSEAALGDLPLAGFAINLDIQNMTAEATFAATEGTLTITDICPGTGATFPPDGRLVGTLTNVKFSAVDGLLSGNPVITPGGCTIPATGTIPSITFTFGETSCTPAAQ
ncbi:MAG TPA: hypothetical protein VM261_01650 [Kofleriaceae bacterium]|nr:hypothetical protein [Kofleriaceae bacterium]